MSTFPTLSTDPSRVPWSPAENVIKSDPMDGLPMARKRHTKTHTAYQPYYSNMSSADVAALMSFYDTVGMVSIFDWTYQGVTRAVRFEAPPEGTDLPAGWCPVSISLITT